jgi:hypothetical protein
MAGGPEFVVVQQIVHGAKNGTVSEGGEGRVRGRVKTCAGEDEGFVAGRDEFVADPGLYLECVGRGMYGIEMSDDELISLVVGKGEAHVERSFLASD